MSINWISNSYGQLMRILTIDSKYDEVYYASTQWPCSKCRTGFDEYEDYYAHINWSSFRCKPKELN